MDGKESDSTAENQNRQMRSSLKITAELAVKVKVEEEWPASPQIRICTYSVQALYLMLRRTWTVGQTMMHCSV